MVPTLVMLWLLMAAAPETTVGRMLRQGFIEAPARALNRITRGYVMLTILLAAVIAGLVWLMGEEMVRLFSMMAPEAMSWLVMVDAASLVDAAVAAVLVAGSVRIGAVKTRLGAALRRVARRPRAVRTRATRVARGADNDDEGPRTALAA